MTPTNCEESSPVENLFTCYLFDLSAIFKSLESYLVCNDKTASVNTVKAYRATAYRETVWPSHDFWQT